ncbi:MAG: hypothetical protein CVU65_18080 [Deltaproteobacteria bacterium HGW-Deltaproteobacteria-22]|nr:MAG: hypothetical protein CVU65_18080 [Deltaproteobacteria bacterium HGW-Deltaproteobacteria-22]
MTRGQDEGEHADAADESHTRVIGDREAGRGCEAFEVERGREADAGSGDEHAVQQGFGRNGLVSPVLAGLADGRVGDGSTNLRRIPFSLPLPPGLKATAVVAGATHTCALYSDSTLRCWGSGLAGQLGEGTIGRFNQPRSILFR